MPLSPPAIFTIHAAFTEQMSVAGRHEALCSDCHLEAMPAVDVTATQE